MSRIFVRSAGFDASGFELIALRVLLIAKGIVTEQEWNRCLERIQKRFAGASEAEVQNDLIERFLHKFDGRRQ